MQQRKRMGGALAALALLVAACSTAPGASPTATGGAPTGTAGTSPTGAAAPLSGELTVWHTYESGAGTEKAVYDELVTKIQTENPDLKITTLIVPFFGAGNIFEKFGLEAKTGGGPDLIIAPNDSLGAQVRQELLLQLDDKLAGKLDGMKDLAVEGCKVDGKLYCVPESLKAVAMYYDSAKVSTAPATTDDLRKAVTDKTIKLGINSGSYHNFGYWAAFGGELMDESGKCVADQGGVADALKFLQDLKAAGATYYTDYAKFADAFKAGTTDVIVDGPWASGGYKTAVAGLAVAPMAAGPSGPAQPLTGTDGWYVNANAADPDLAIEFALRMVSTDYEQVFVDKAGHIPADEAATISDPLTEGFATAVETGFARPQNKELDNFWAQFDAALANVMEKNGDPTAEVAKACAEMNRLNGK